MEVDSRVFDFLCFCLFPPVALTVTQKMQGHALPACGSWGVAQGHQAEEDELTAINQIRELSLFNLIQIIIQ